MRITTVRRRWILTAGFIVTLALACTDGVQPLVGRMAEADAGERDIDPPDAAGQDVGDAVDAAPDVGIDPGGCATPDPLGPVLWTQARDGVLTLEGPTCLPRFIPLSVSDGEPPYAWWIMSSLVPPGVRIDDANRASARLAIPAGFVGELDIQVWDSFNAVAAVRVVSPERGQAAWWPVSSPDGGLRLVDACSRAEVVLSDDARGVDQRGRWLTYFESRAGQVVVYRIDLYAEVPEARIVDQAGGAFVRNLRVLSAAGALGFTDAQGELHLVRPGADGVRVAPADVDTRVQSHRREGATDIFIVRRPNVTELLTVSDSLARRTLMGRSTDFILDARFGRDGLLVQDTGELRLESLTGEVLVSTPFEGSLARTGPDQTWRSWERFIDTNSGTLSLLRLGEGCLDRIEIPDRLASSHSWLLGGRAGYAVLRNDRLLTWVVRDDDSLVFDVTDGNPPLFVSDGGTGARTRLIIKEGEEASVVVLAADGGLSHRISLPHTRSLALSRNGSYYTHDEAGRVFVEAVEGNLRIEVSSVASRTSFHPTGLALATFNVDNRTRFVRMNLAGGLQDSFTVDGTAVPLEEFRQ